MTTPTLQSYPTRKRTEPKTPPDVIAQIKSEYVADCERLGIAYGTCFCGCKETTPIHSRTYVKIRILKGMPMRHIFGHQHRIAPTEYVVQDCGFYKGSCWIWQLAKDAFGYGKMYDKKAKKMTTAYRHFYEQANGAVPDGLYLDHLCRVPSCVNPDHLEAVTNAVNVQRGLRARMTLESIAQVHALRHSGMTYRAISAEMSIPERTIAHIIRGDRWKNVVDADGFESAKNVPAQLVRDSRTGRYASPINPLLNRPAPQH